MKAKILICLLILALLVLPALASEETFNVVSIQKNAIYSGTTSSVTWASLHDADSGTVYTSYLMPGISTHTTTNGWKRIYRGYLVINSSGLPDDCTIDFAYIRVHIYEVENSLGGNLEVVYFFPVNPSDPVASDFDRFGTNVYNSTPVGGLPTGYYDIYLDDPESIVSKTGLSYFGFRISSDVDNSAPGWVGGGVSTLVKMSNDVGHGPWLVVNYSVAGASALAANFTGTPTSGSIPLTVQFNDTSTNTPLYWSWDFGDGYYYSGTSAFAQNPAHTYNSVGLYDVSLYIQNAIGSDNETKVNYINTTTGIPASYNFRCRIYDTSYNAIDGATFNIAYYNNTTIQTDTTHNGGYVYFTVPNYQMIYGNVSKAGYEQTDFIINFGTSYDSHQMLYHSWEIPEIPTYYGTLMLSVLDSTTLTGIPSAKIDVYTDDTGTTKIDTQYTDYSGWGWAMTEPLNQELYYVVSHPSYTTRDFTYNMTYSPAYYSLLLTKIGTLPETYGYNLTVTGIDAITSLPLNNVWFTVSSTSNVYNNYAVKTNSTGIAVIGHIPPGTYYLTSLLSGYYPTNQTVSILADSSRTVYLSPYTGTPVATFTPVQTPVWTGEGGQPGNAMEGLINFFLSLGIGVSGAMMLIALAIIATCAILIGKVAGGTGAMIGACIGFVACCTIGLLPIWLLFVSIIIIGAVFFIFKTQAPGG